MSTTTLQIRIDSKMKRAARKTFEGMGLDLSSGVKLLLSNVVTRQALPNDIRTVNGFTVAEEREILRDAEEAERSGKYYANGKDLLASIK